MRIYFMGKPLLYSLAVFIGFLTFFLIPSQAWSHKVNVFAWPEGTNLHIESKFSGGRPVQNTPVEVYKIPDNTLLFSGTTNEQGELLFPLPPSILKNPVGLKIVLTASMGHKDEWLVRPEEIAEAAAETDGGAASKSTAQPQTTSQPSTSMKTKTDLKEEAVQKAMEKALDKKLAPVLRKLAEMEQQGPSLSEIIGGLGYIVGLLGVYVYFRSKKAS